MNRAKQTPMAVVSRHWLLNGRLLGVSDHVDIGIEQGVVRDVRRTGSQVSATSSALLSDSDVDLAGLLLLPSLRENHAHLDKALTADSIVNESGDLMGAIDAWIDAERKGLIGFEEMCERARTAVVRLVRSGVTDIRTHVNVGESDIDLRNLRAIEAVRREMKDLVTIEIVALLHSPMTGSRSAGNRSALDAAIEFGVDAIGGCPHLEPDPEGMIDLVLRRARSAGLELDLHVDETLDPTMLTLRTLARKVIDEGFALPVTASHCVSLSMQPLQEQIAMAKLLKKARIRVVALPQTNLFLQGWEHVQAVPRAIAPLSLLADHGVEVAAGGDNVEDPFNPVGRSDPLETASLLVMAGHLTPEAAVDAVSTRSSGLRAEDLIGSPANFVAIEASNLRQAVARSPITRTTIRNGRVVSQTSVRNEVFRSSN